MESKNIPEILEDDNTLLMRWVDDFFLVTLSLDLAEAFLTILCPGLPEYGCSINKYKTVTNVPKKLLPEIGGLQRVTGEWFLWCGLLFNTKTLEVRCSYSRYYGKQYLLFLIY